MRKFIVIGVGLLLSACASGPSAYGPAYGKSELGYTNTRLQQDRFRVSYTSRNVNESRDLVLLRTAEIAEAEGYSHFKIVHADTFGNGGSSPVSTSVGIGKRFGGHHRHGHGTHVDVAVGVYDVVRAMEGEKVTETVEVVLQSSGSQDPNVYEAASIKKYIRPESFKSP